jgi:hypothetical protein
MPLMAVVCVLRGSLAPAGKWFFLVPAQRPRVVNNFHPYTILLCMYNLARIAAIFLVAGACIFSRTPV